MRVLVTGVNGQLGHDVVKELQTRGHTPIGTDITPEYQGMDDIHPEYVALDLTDEDAVRTVMHDVHPDALVHCAAWTAVDAAEDNQDKVFAINETGTQYLATAARACDAVMMYISTDYVFSGDGETPWDPDDTNFAPLNVYGASKLAGENAVRRTLDKYFIVRIAWVFGKNGGNFVRTMLKVGETHNQVRVVNDQIGTPTYTEDLARLLVDMLETDKYGHYHVTNSGGYISWYDFTKEIYKQAGLKTEVIPVTTEEYGLSKAKRPFNSRLDKSKLEDNGFTPLPQWQDAVKRYVEALGYGTDHSHKGTD